MMADDFEANKGKKKKGKKIRGKNREESYVCTSTRCPLASQLRIETRNNGYCRRLYHPRSYNNDGDALA